MTTYTCPHCGGLLEPFVLPDQGGWDSPYHLACFNDECPYYIRGWERMEESYGVKSSYRFRIDPTTGKASPLAVWSPTAIRDRILGDEEKEEFQKYLDQLNDSPRESDSDNEDS